METLLQDVRYSVRTLVNKPGFTAMVVITLALGIGANSAIFSVVNSVLLRPLPYEQAERLVSLWENNPNIQFGSDLLPVSAANFADWRDQSQSFESITALVSASFNLTGTDRPERVGGARVSASFFLLFGVAPARGRTFLPEEDHPGRNRVVVISHGLWQSRFGSDPDLIGKTLRLDGENHTVVGIMPAGFNFPKAADLPSYFELPPQTELWTPIAFSPSKINDRLSRGYAALARLKQGVTIEQAQTEMTAIARQLEQQYEDNAGFGVTIISLREQVVGGVRLILLVLLGAAGFVLLIACANVANLMLARASSRQKEMAIRTALGASRLRVVRQMLTESVILALGGGSLGILLARLGTDLLLTLSPDALPGLEEVNVDLTVLGFTLAVSLATGVIFGLAPALQVSTTNLNELLKEGARGSTGSIRSNRVRSLLVVSEVALSLVLLVGAGLMIRSFLRLLSVNPGFNPHGVITMQLDLPQSKYPGQTERGSLFTQVIRRVETLPAVETVGAISHLPLSGGAQIDGILIEGRPPVSLAELSLVNSRAINPDYFRAMGIPILRGRDFKEEDNEQQSPPVAIISAETAARFWPGEDPIGKRIKFYPADSARHWLSVIGIVADLKDSALDAEPKPHMYYPYLQNPWSSPQRSPTSMTLVVKNAASSEGMASALRSEVWAVDKDQPVTTIKTMEQYVTEAVGRRRFAMILLGAFACVALALAAVGIYGVMAYSVSKRSHEIGIRAALGAQSGDVLKMVIGQGMKLALIGVAIGIVASMALTRLMRNLLFEVSATDPMTFVVIAVLLTGVALLACWLPARRATKVDPMVALRYE
ncbi:MAG: ABC transporter permease [Acidobacteriota bacterium]